VNLPFLRISWSPRRNFEQRQQDLLSRTLFRWKGRKEEAIAANQVFEGDRMVHSSSEG
jgi:hypothetical protein